MSLYTQPQKQTPTTRFILPVCTDRAGLSALLSLLHFGAFEAGYLDNEQLFYDVLEALAFIDEPNRTACNDNAPPAKPDKEAIKATMKSFGGMTSLSAEETDEMPCNQIIKIGAQWYLYSDCAGCDEPLYFLLQPTALDSNAQPIPQNDTTKQAGQAGSAPLPSGSVPCFANSATSYLLGRAAAFWNTATDAAVVGIDTALGSYDEVAQYAALAAELVTGNSDIREIAALGKDVIESAIRSSETQTALAAAWTFTEPPSKAELEAWTRNAPFTVNLVPVRTALAIWLKFSIVFNYSNRLNSIIEQCRAGEIEEFGDGLLVFDRNVSGYRIRKFELENTRAIGPSTSHKLGTFNNVVAIAIRSEGITGTGGSHRYRINNITGDNGGATTSPFFIDYEMNSGTNGLLNIGASINLGQTFRTENFPEVAAWGVMPSESNGVLYFHDYQHQYDSNLTFSIVERL